MTPGDPVYVSTLAYTGRATYVRELRGDRVEVETPTGLRKVRRSDVRGQRRRTSNKLVRRPDYSQPPRQPAALTVPPTVRLPKYLAWVRSLPCCCCGRTEGVEASHHPLDGGSTAAKPTDLNAVPLCAECHRGEWHRTGALPGMDSRQTAEWLATRVRWLNQAWIAECAAAKNSK